MILDKGISAGLEQQVKVVGHENVRKDLEAVAFPILLQP
jgi:hypothetical protein